MEEIGEKFISEFHQLKGITVAEKKRALFQLFRKNASLFEDKSLQDFVTSRLKPQTHLEKLFFVEFLIHHRRFDELFEQFLKGDEIVIRKLAKQNWFFREAFDDVDANFIARVFPSLSFNVKMKILKKMAPVLDEKRADQIFDVLLERYGLGMATNILTQCSVDKIEQILKNHPVKLWPDQLRLLHDKSQNLISVYLEEREKHDGNRRFMDSNPIFQYIAQKNPDLYAILCQKYHFKIKLGKRASEKVIAATRAEIIARPELHVKNLNPTRLIRKLGPDFKRVFLKLFPKRTEDSPKAESSRLLKYYPKRGRYDLLMNTYDQIFYKKLEECPHLIDMHLLEMVSDPDEREKLTKIKYGDDFMWYYRTDSCLRAVKEKINFARVPYERSRFVQILVDCCVLNDDLDALLEVGKFVSERFKNDSFEVQHAFARTLLLKKFDFGRLDEDHWECLKNYTHRLDLDNFNYGDNDNTLRELFFRHIEFLAKTGKCMNEEIERFFKNKEFRPLKMSLAHNPKVEKLFLDAFIGLAPSCCTSTTIEDLDCQVILSCSQYNKRNPNDPVDIHTHPRLIRSVKDALINDIDVQNGALPAAIHSAICTKHRNEEIDEIIRLCWPMIGDVGTPATVRWFLKNRPEIIQIHFDAFIGFATSNKEINQDDKTWRTIKTYSHLELDKKTIEFCLAKLTDPYYKDVHFFVRPLSLLMSQREFFTFAESYRPDTYKTDLQNEEMNWRFQILRNVLKGLKKAVAPGDALTLILRFCGGDYVHSCLGPLYSASYNTPEYDVKPFIDELSKREPISIKKHAFYLTAALFDADSVLNTLKLCHLNQSLSISFKYFLKSPSEATWDLFKNKLTYLRKNDATTLRLLVNKSIPEPYKTEHFKIIWEILHERNSDELKIMLLKKVQNSTIFEMQPDFLHNLVENNLFTIKQLDVIVCNYLIACKQQNKIDAIFDALRRVESSSKRSKKNLHDFIHTFFDTYMKSVEENIDLITIFAAKFEQLFPVAETFEEYILLAVLKFKNQSLNDLAKSIVELHENLILKYGESIVEIFTDCLRNVVPYFCDNVTKMYEFYYLLLNSKRSVDDIVLVIKLLPTDSEPEDRKSFEYYDHTLAQLQGINLANVQLHLNLHFKFHRVILDYAYYIKTNRFCMNTSSWLVPGAQRQNNRAFMWS